MTKFANASLSDKYTLSEGRAFMTGIQALVRLPMMQRRRDLQAGHETAGFISGYRGSPLGALDLQLRQAEELLTDHQVVFKPGVNEDLAATAAWGTQQAELNGEGKYDGVFALWYGKGPGVDRSGDALRHSNLAGTSALGGVLALLGDDHTCESSTTAHQSEYAMVDAMIPVLNPAGVQEILDYGLYGWAMSRYSGCWVSLKCVHDTVEASASVEVGAEHVRIQQPDDHVPPQGGLNIRWPDTPQAQEARLHEHKLDAARAFCRVNRLDRLVFDSPDARIGVVTTGKSYLDVRQALMDLDVDMTSGLRLYKVAMTWPLEPQGIREFCAGLDQVVVIEEKRGLIEGQLKALMYGQAGAPAVVGKNDEQGRILFPSAGRLDSNHIAAVIGSRMLQLRDDAHLRTRVDEILSLNATGQGNAPALQRKAWFCAGCPHNTSTRVPEGSVALAGIGCHYMAQWMNRDTDRFTQMGGEGASWIGESLFNKREHVFQNIGDGTYFHSGLLAIRAAISAGSNVTFKILYNDAVAMTGGQSVDGPLSVPRITQQVHAEGARCVVVVSDEPDKYVRGIGFAPDVRFYHRSELDAVQRELREMPGTTILIYDQTCAAEKRRRRKRGLYPDPPRRVFINEAVCEGCGDCGLKSNCVAILPKETALGRKREIDQSACNKDYSCVEGFCPSFVTVHGGELRRATAGQSAGPDVAALPEPALPRLDEIYSIVVTGVGGTGVITIGALLGMAAHLEEKGCSVIDMTGLAQKGGAVMSHVIIGERPESIATMRIANGGAHLMLGCDLVVTASDAALRTARSGQTQVIANSHESMTGEFAHDANLEFPRDSLRARIERAAGREKTTFLSATRIATVLLGDSIATNLFMLGYAWQQGFVPVSAAAIAKAIELNNVAVDANKQAFDWGRCAAADLDAVERIAQPSAVIDVASRRAQTLDDIIEHRTTFLKGYQSARYARRYRSVVEKVRVAEARKISDGTEAVTRAVAMYYFKLLAYKDEYEVARLYTSGEFQARLAAQFEGDVRLEFHLAPPLLARRDPVSGELRKRAFGPWIMKAFSLLAPLRRVRGTPLDVFGYSAERREERRLIADYEVVVVKLLETLDAGNIRQAVEIASLPEQIRGFGHVKSRSIETVRQRQEELLTAYRQGIAAQDAAA